MGCSYRQHKWQRLQMVFVPRLWQKFNRGLWASPKEGLVTLTAIASIGVFVVEAMQLLL
jgi:hypothetical protein